MSTVPMTPEGLEKLHVQLRHIREVDRPQNVRDIEEARAHGDLKENAEYHAAKERQGHLDGQMKRIETMIATAQIIDPTTLSGDRVVFGATVTLVDAEEDDAEPVQYKIVGEHESDLSAGKISYTSPVAKALIGKSEGDEVPIHAPNGKKVVIIDEVDFV